LYSLSVYRILCRLCIWLMKSNNLWLRKIGWIAYIQHKRLAKFYKMLSSLHSVLLCRIALLALHSNCANSAIVVQRCILGRGTLTNLINQQLPQLPCEQVFYAFEKTILKKDNARLLEELQSIVNHIPIANQNLQQLGFSLKLFATIFNLPKSIEIINEIQSKDHVLLAVPVPVPIQFIFVAAATWQFPLDQAIKAAIHSSSADWSSRERMLKFTYAKALLQHYGIKALQQPHTILECALGQNAMLAKYLILHSNIRTWYTHLYRLYENDEPFNQSDPLFITCLSPQDIEELYDHHVDTRYLIRLTIHDPQLNDEMLDGGQVLHLKFVNHKQTSAFIQIHLHQFPTDIVCLLMSYV
jgi:hypothetical protein